MVNFQLRSVPSPTTYLPTGSPKKSKILTKEKINKLIQEASDIEYLMTRVASIFGISGACRMDELVKMTLQDVEDLQSKLLISIPGSKINKPRSFVVNQMYLNVYRKYVALNIPKT
ncbi:hypothetical protein NQ317_000644 [Molorchus minor]|uniref:Tyr recombinase domain-containing protein n=1 Tax=Molorchus minor TaxID=1323400 RepID=A0ABQ9J1C9_9CUCU|nr:hypothetical protein NQ317_000644 [Molorchus minor]